MDNFEIIVYLYKYKADSRDQPQNHKNAMLLLMSMSTGNQQLGLLDHWPGLRTGT